MTFRAKLIGSYVCATLVLLVGMAAFTQSHQSSLALARSVALRNTIRTALEAEVLLLNAEAGQRGYLLSGDESYLRPYQLAAPLVAAKIELLKSMIAPSDAAQQRRVGQFGEHARRKLIELASTLQMHRKHGDVRQIFATHQGQVLTDAIHQEVNAIVQQARKEREIEDASVTRLHTFAQWLVGVGNAAAFALAVAVTIWISGAFREGEAARRSVEEQGRVLGENAKLVAAQDAMLAARVVEQALLHRNLERTNEALQRSNADLEQFAYIASHDLRGPLRGIASLTDWIQEDVGESLSADSKRHFAALRSRIQRLDALVVGIASYSRAGRKQESAELVDVDKLVRDVIELVAPPDGVKITIDSTLPVIETARVPLQQVFLNLLSNAIKHGVSEAVGAISVRCVEDAGFWRFSISDRGPGIASEYHRKIFDLFQTLAARDRVEGTGIGLALVTKLVDRYGGKVSVESTLGEGSTFCFTWPTRPVFAESVVANG